MAKKKSNKKSSDRELTPEPTSGPEPDGPSREPRRHADLYFDEPDTRVFQVHNVLFKLHPLILRRYCDYFREVLTSVGDYVPLRATGEEESMKPIAHVHGYLTAANAADIPLKEFELAVRLFYPETLLTSPLKGESDWILVLDASHRWQSSYLRAAAILNLEKLKLAPDTRLNLCTKYGINQWLENICTRLCRRQRPLDSREVIALGARRATAVRGARHKLLKKICGDLIKPCSRASGNCAIARLELAHQIYGLLQSLASGHEWDDIIEMATKPNQSCGSFCSTFGCSVSQWQIGWNVLVKAEMQGIMQLAPIQPVLHAPIIPAISTAPATPAVPDIQVQCDEPAEEIVEPQTPLIAPPTPTLPAIHATFAISAVSSSSVECPRDDTVPVEERESVLVSQALEDAVGPQELDGIPASPILSSAAPASVDADVHDSLVQFEEPIEDMEETTELQASLDDFVLT